MTSFRKKMRDCDIKRTKRTSNFILGTLATVKIKICVLMTFVKVLLILKYIFFYDQATLLLKYNVLSSNDMRIDQ